MKSKSLNSLFSSTSSRALRASLVLFISALAANAATFTWDGGGADAITSTAANWVGDIAPPAGSDLVFNAAGISGSNITYASGNLFSMTFGPGASAYTIGVTTAQIQFVAQGANTAPIVNNSSNIQTFSAPVHVFFNGNKTFAANTAALSFATVAFRADTPFAAGGTNTLVLSGANNGTISGPLIQNGTFTQTAAGLSTALTKTGTGTWTLSGASTFGGNVTVSDGILKAGGASVANVSGAFGLNTAVTTANIATAVLDLNGFNTQIGSLAGGGALGGNVTLGSNILTTGGNNTNTSYAGVISGTGGALTKIGTGVQTLSGANLYDSGTAINAGTLIFLNTTAKPTTGTVTVAAGATIGLGVGAASPQFLLADVDGLFAGSMPGVTNNIASLVGIDTSAGGSITYATSTPANTRGLTKFGGGVLTLTGTNLHTGATTLTGGTLSVGVTENLGNANPLIFDGGNLQITGTALTSYASGAISGHAVTLVPNKSVTFDISDATNVFTINQILNQGTGGFTKAGAGAVKLTALNTYTGFTTLNAGNLIATDPAAFSSGKITFASATTKLSLQMDGGGTISLPNPLGSASGFITTIDVNNNGTGINGVIQINGSSANSTMGNGTINVTGSNGYSLHIANLRSTAGAPGALNFVPSTAALTLGNLSGTQNAGSNVWTLLGSNTASAVTGVISNGGSGTLTSAVQKSNAGTWTLSGANTYTGKSQIFNGTLNVSSINSVAAAAAAVTSSNLGAPVTVALGTIDLGSATATGNLNYTGTGEITDRVLNLSGTTGGGTVTQSGVSGLLKFTSDLTATGVGTKALTLQGSDVGTGEISGVIPDGIVGTTSTSAAFISGATTVTLASVAGLVNGASISGTGITPGTTVASFVANTRVVTLSTATTGAGTSGQAMTVAGVINQNSLTKSGTGTWTLSGANTHTGTTTIQNGTLTLSGNRTVNSGGITLGGTADSPILNIQNGNFALGGSFTIGNAGNTAVVNHSAGTISNVGGNGILLGNGNCNATYNLSGGSLTGGIRLGVNNATSGNVNNFNLSGTGSLTSSSLQIGRADAAGSLNTDNTFTQSNGTAAIAALSLGGRASDSALTTPIVAKLDLTAGTFTATTFNSLSAGGANTSTIIIGGSAQVTLPAFPTGRSVSPVSLGLASTATITFDGGTLIPATTDATYMSGLTNAYLTANGAKIATNGFDITIAQVLENAPSAVGTLTKSGVGTLTLTGINTYSGNTTVNDGILSITNTYLADSSTLTIGSVAASPAVLNLPNAGTDTVASLVIDGVAQPNGLYDSTNSAGAITGIGKIQVGAATNTYANWLAANPPATGFTTDTDNDGVPNGVENVLGTNPNASSAGLTQVSATASSVTFQHTLNPTIASNVNYSYQWSSDLTEWQASGVANSAGTIGTIVPSAPASGVVTVVTTRTGTASTKLFTRIKAGNP